GALERHAIAPAADGARDDVAAVADAVDRDEHRDAVAVAALGEEVADASQVAGPLLADVANKEDVAGRPYAGFVQRADDGEDDGRAARVVADARRQEARLVAFHADVGGFGEHRVEVRGDGEERAVAGATSQPHHVAFFIALDVLEACLL